MKTILSLSIFLVAFAVSGAEYPELSEATMTALERIRKFTKDEAEFETKFWLYTRKNREVNEGQLLKRNDTDVLKSSHFNVTHPVRFLIHGYRDKKDTEFNTMITKAYLAKGDFNVIVVDWGALSKVLPITWQYKEVAASIKYLSPILAEFALFLNGIGVPFEEMYLIGHSLGAHVAGMAGQLVKPHQFHAIFGLDPAGPEFQDIHDDHRLDKGDAYYVESIQTHIDGIEGLTGFLVSLIAPDMHIFGYSGAIGNASFFPNYAIQQPGCGKAGCSHSRAYEYFAASLDSSNHFYGRRCRNFQEILKKHCTHPERHVLMGGDPAHTGRGGIFYVRTGNSTPYSVEQPDPSRFVDMRLPLRKSLALRGSPSRQQATRILICDQTEGYDASALESCRKIEKAYSKKKVNFIFVNYDRAVQEKLLDADVNIDDIAHVVANNLRELHKTGISYDQMYLIGVGKGVEIAYKAASEIAPEKINTLFALEYSADIDKSPFKYVESISAYPYIDNGNTNVVVRTRSRENAVDAFIDTITKKGKNMAHVCKNYDDLGPFCRYNTNLMSFGGEPSNQQNQQRAEYQYLYRDYRD